MKMNKAEHEAALTESSEYIMENLASWSSYTTWAKAKYKINIHQATNLWKECWKIIAATVDIERSEKKQYYLSELERIKTEAQANGDRANELKAVSAQIKLDGLDVQQLEIKGELNIKTEWGPRL